MPLRHGEADFVCYFFAAWTKVRRRTGERAMTIDWEAISTLSELVGAVAVIVTLCYVAVQIRQNTNAIVANARQGLLDADLGLISDFISHSVDPHLLRDGANLTPEDERRMIWLLIKALRIREFAWHQYKSGNLDEKSWQSYMAPVAGMFATQRSKAVLKFYTGSPEFAKMLADWLSTHEPQPIGNIPQVGSPSEPGPVTVPAP